MTGLAWLLIGLLCLTEWAYSDGSDPSCPEQCRCNQDVADCSKTNATDIPKGISQDVRMLNLSQNKLKIVKMPELKFLEQLDLSQNEITDVTIENLWLLQSLDISNNSLKSVKSKNLGNLKTLNLSYNKNLNLPAETAISEPLEYIDMSFCDVKSLQFVNRLPHLKFLILKGNTAPSLYGVKSETLTHIDVSKGKIRVIDVETLLNYPNLLSLDVSENADLTLTFSHKTTCLKLEKLAASSTGMSRVLLPSLCKLQIADLSHNGITFIDKLSFKSNEHLNSLNLSFNGLGVIDKDAFNSTRNLLNLDLTANSLEKGDWAEPLESLKSLNISMNRLKSLEDLKLPALLFLDISNNKISVIPKNISFILPQLEYLDLSKNELERIKPIKLPKLKRLILKSCQIEWVEDHAFDEMEDLEYVDLSKNKLTLLYYSTLSAIPNLLSVQLGHNPWDCDCKGDWLKDLFEYLVVNHSLTSLSDLQCHLPDEGHKNWQDVCGKQWSEAGSHYRSAIQAPLIIIGVFAAALFTVAALIYFRHKFKSASTVAEDPAVEEPLNSTIPQINRATLRRSQSAAAMTSVDDLPPSYEEALRMAPRTMSMDAITDRRLSPILE